MAVEFNKIINKKKKYLWKKIYIITICVLECNKKKEQREIYEEKRERKKIY